MKTTKTTELSNARGLKIIRSGTSAADSYLVEIDDGGEGVKLTIDSWDELAMFVMGYDTALDVKASLDRIAYIKREL
jgi:hypothetical protein